MLDLSKNDPSKQAEAGYTFNVVMPDGTKTDATITVRGSNSPVVKNYSRRVYQEFKVREQQAKRRGREVEELTLEEAEELAAQSAAVRVIGWTGIGEEGKEVKFSKEKAREVMLAHSWIREAVMQEAADLTNFQPK